jgi:asparagine synthase (glutamine-hydrolysing)
MCGIAGIFFLGASGSVQVESLAKMGATLHHRGPDDGGCWLADDRSVGLVHRRLAIADPSPLGRQPMHNEAGTLSLIFNGEIYNHNALRRELQSEGYRFRSESSDTEVLLHAYDRWGDGCIDRLRGMFAFAIWDSISRCLVLARDRIGIKPLFYSISGGAVVFASEINAIFASCLRKKEIDENGVYDYLTFLTVPAPGTLFRDVCKLEAGCVLRVTAEGRTEQRRYWNSATFLNAPLPQHETTAIETTEELLRDAVASMMSPGMPLAATLSGGIDSALVAALMARDSQAFSSITMDYEVESPYSESNSAGRLARALNIANTSRAVTSDELMTAFRELMANHGNDPLGANDALLLYLLSRELHSQGVKVCIVGEGADELGGYPSYLDCEDEYRTLCHFSKLPDDTKAAVFRCCRPDGQEYLDIAMGKSVTPRRHVQGFSEHAKRRLWRRSPQESSYAKLQPLMDEIRDDGEDSFLRKLQHIEFRLRLPEFMLSRIDRSMMACSVEARVPFLDHPLVEYSLRLPMSLKMKARTPKFLFRSVLSKYLDESLISRRKIGFGRVMTPFLNHVVAGSFRREIVDDKDHPLFEFLKYSPVENMMVEHEQSGSGGYHLWLLYSLGKWLAAY